MLAAASLHEVWVLTAMESIDPIQKALLEDPRASKIHLEGIEFGVSTDRIIDLTAMGYHWRYDRWQRTAAARGLALDKSVDFDVVHHATLASYWTRAGVALVEKPLVWGPIGGGVIPPIRLMPELGPRGVLEAVARIVGRPSIALLPAVKKTQQLAAVILAQNPDTGRRLRGAKRIKLLSNALAVELDSVKNSGPRSADLLFAARLVPWKGPMLALRALRYVDHPEAVLHFYGDGPERERARLRRAAQKWGLMDRVRFEGWIPRASLLPLLARAGALVHPAFHDEAPLCIAEALTLGTPVVALDHGGPAQIVGEWEGPSALVSPSDPGATARSMASAIDRFLRNPPPVRERPVKAKTSFEAELLRSYEEATTS